MGASAVVLPHIVVVDRLLEQTTIDDESVDGRDGSVG
jgi:hypothetical protein